MFRSRWVFTLSAGVAIAAMLATVYRRHAQRSATVEEPVAPPSWTPQQTVLGVDEVRIPIELDGGTPVIPFTSNGRQWRLELDTGAGWNVATPAFAAAAAATTQPTALPYQDAAGAGTTLGIATFPTFGLSGVTFKTFDAGLVEIRGPYDALLGWRMWRDLLVTISYPKRLLVLRRGSLPKPDGQQILPLHVSDAGLLKIPVTLGGHERWLVLDTGCGEPDCLDLTAATAAKVRWMAGPQGKYPQSTVGHASVQMLGVLEGDMVIGRYHFTNVVAGTHQGSHDDVLGAWILENFTLTLDLINLRAELERPDNRTIRFGNTVASGFRCNSRGPIRMVLSVLRGSEAERAGLRRGDVVLRINGHPATDDTAVSDSSKPMVLDVMRGFKRLTLRFPWTNLDR